MRLLKILLLCIIVLILTLFAFSIETTDEPIYYDTPIDTGVRYCMLNK